MSAITVDPFQTVDPFASQSDIGSPTTIANNDWFQTQNNGTTNNDPFLSKTDVSSKDKKDLSKKTSIISTQNGSRTNTNGNNWTPFNNTNSSNTVQYRALYDYKPERPDEIPMSMGDVITVS